MAIKIQINQEKSPEFDFERLKEALQLLQDSAESFQIEDIWYGIDFSKLQDCAVAQSKDKLFTNCKYYSDNGYFKCAVNPSNPCENCSDFEN